MSLFAANLDTFFYLTNYFGNYFVKNTIIIKLFPYLDCCCLIF